MDAFVLTREVEAEVRGEVAVGLHGTELEDRLRPGQPPPRTGNVQPVSDKMAVALPAPVAEASWSRLEAISA